MSGGWDDDKWIICIGFPDGGDRQTSPYVDYVGVVYDAIIIFIYNRIT